MTSRGLATAAAIAGLLLAGCGGDDDDTSADGASPATTATATTTTARTPEGTQRDRISSCLTGLGYKLTGGATGIVNANAADYQIVFQSRNGGGYIGFYKNASRAQRVVAQLRRNAARVTGAGAEGHGAINIVWIDLAGDADRADVRNCLVD